MILDFLIGLFATNALPHFLFAKLDARVLSLFGYSPRANFAYSVFCLLVAATIYIAKYGFSALSQHMMLFGGVAVVFSFYVGWNFIDRFLRDTAKTNGDKT